jgi:putative hemolysin
MPAGSRPCRFHLIGRGTTRHGRIFILLGLIVVNGVFAMSELAIVSARTARLQSKADQGDVGAKTVINLQADPSRFLSTVQIGITLVGIIAGAYGATAIADELSPLHCETGAGH